MRSRRAYLHGAHKWDGGPVIGLGAMPSAPAQAQLSPLVSSSSNEALFGDPKPERVRPDLPGGRSASLLRHLAELASNCS